MAEWAHLSMAAAFPFYKCLGLRNFANRKVLVDFAPVKKFIKDNDCSRYDLIV